MTNWSDSSASAAQLLPIALRERWQRHPTDPVAFAEAHRRFGGEPMAVPPALHAPYRDPHPFVAIQKPAQAGVTESNLLLATHFAVTKPGGRGNVLILFPTQEIADRISQQRYQAMLDQSPALAALQTPGAPQRKELRTVAGASIHFVGADQPTQYTGIDADLVIVDEFDLIKDIDAVVSNAQARTRSSRAARLRFTSTPTVPSFGIHALLEESDERHYELQCDTCGAWIAPLYPDHVDFDAGRVRCPCGAPLDPLGPGRWLPRRPGARIHGYQLNRLVLPDPPLAAMRAAAAGGVGMRLEDFHRLDLGLPFVAEDARLTEADLDACRVETVPDWLQAGRRLPEDVTLVIGVDVGVRDFWVVVHAFRERREYLLCARRIEGGWEELLRFCDDLRAETGRPIAWGVIDALPDTRGAAEFHRAIRDHHSGYIFLCYYTRERDHDFNWPKIQACRTLALDEMFARFRRRQIALPPSAREVAGGHYYQHMVALVRTTTPDDFGQPIPTYVHTRPDDFAHATNYVRLVAGWLGTYHGWAE